MALAGTILGGRYELAEQIGSGGYCEVWRATDTVLSRPLAVKLLYPGYAAKVDVLARFRAEARHAGALSHPNITRVYDHREPADGQPPYVVMELVDGPSLEDVLARGPLDARQSMDIIAQAAAGLQAAHAARLIHRDIKPANLLLARGGTVKITDFGIAHAVGSAAVTPSGEIMGTPGYHAPEQVAGEQVTPASDLYALGVVAYECLAGAPPFAGSAVEMAVAHRDRPLPLLPPPVPADVSAFVAELTAKDPARRPGSAAEVARRAGQLRDGLLGGTGGELYPPPELLATAAADEQPRPVRRRPALALAAMVVAGLTGLVLASLIGFAPAWHTIRVPGSTPSSRAPGTVGPVRSGASPGAAISSGAATSPPPAAAQPRATAGNASTTAIAGATTAPAKPGHGHGHGNGSGNGNGNGNGQGNGNGNAAAAGASG
jgi:hypothetical protein